MVDMNKLLKEAQKMQQRMEKMKEEVAGEEISHSSGGGMVTATINGNHELVDLKIDPEVIDPEEKEMLEDMIIAAINGANEKIDKYVQEKFGELSGGMGGIPGLM